jgi:hypothetical protein
MERLTDFFRERITSPKRRGEPMLYEELSQKFPCQVIEPFKEPVLAIPVKQFKAEWEPKLKAEGCRIVLSNYLGQSVFLIRKSTSLNSQSSNMEEKPNVVTSDNIPKPKTNVGSPEPTSSQPTPQPSQPQNIEEPIIQLIREGKTFKEIRESLGLTHAQLMGYLSNLKRRGVLDKIGWTPKRKRKASTREAKVEPAKPSLNTSNLPIREMLEASLMLLDSHPKVVRLLLQKCMESLP